jgi:heat-inducible transcriptional repressor
MQGTIGIIGPKRMDYENVMQSLKTVKAALIDVFGNTGSVVVEDTEREGRQ